jgi:hypothetical protein
LIKHKHGNKWLKVFPLELIEKNIRAIQETICWITQRMRALLYQRKQK